MEIKDIEKLAKLARIDLTEQQKTAYLKEIGAILGYVDQIKDIVSKTGDERKIPDLRNVSRADTISDLDADRSDRIVKEFPRSEKNYLKVKKILEQ
ncbi:MAG: Asp-tRNA(Asn)/Glu-tRNA(Gln) amidotransferase subunit GatC [Candidatus Paceibacterota bacterium]